MWIYVLFFIEPILRKTVMDIQPFDQFMLALYVGFIIGFNALCWIYGERF